MRSMALCTAGLPLHAMMRWPNIGMARQTDPSIRTQLLMRFMTGRAIQGRHRRIGRKNLPPDFDLLMTSQASRPIGNQWTILLQKLVTFGTMNEGHLSAGPFHLIGVTGQTGIDRPQKFMHPSQVTVKAINPRLCKMDLVTSGLSDQLPLRIIAQVTLGTDLVIQLRMSCHLTGAPGQIKPDLMQTRFGILLVTLMTGDQVMRRP